MMTVLRVHPGKKPEVVVIEEGLKSLQHEVDGYIEVIYPFTDPVAVVLNEDGSATIKDNGRGIKRVRFRDSLITEHCGMKMGYHMTSLLVIS